MPRGIHPDWQGSAPMSNFQGSAMTSVGGYRGQPGLPTQQSCREIWARSWFWYSSFPGNFVLWHILG